MRTQASKGSEKAGGRRVLQRGKMNEHRYCTGKERDNCVQAAQCNSRLYVPNGSNGEPSFAISSLLFAPFPFSFLRRLFPFLPAIPQWRRTRDHATSVSLSRPKGKIHARNGRDEKSRRWRSKRSLRLLFTSERLFINTAVSKYRNGCQTFHSSTSIRLFFSFLLFFFFFLSSLIHCSSN